MDALLNTLKALPGIAGSPLAVVAYIVVIGSWVVSYLRTARFKILMDRIRALPEADRKAVVQLEMNTVLPASISAEQWLRSRRQLYIVVAYVLTLLAALLLLTLAFLNRGGLSLDGVRVKTGDLGLVTAARGTEMTPIEGFKKRPESTKHDYRFDLTLRNSANAPATVTAVTVTFDPDEPGFLAETLKVSNTYVVLLNADGTGKVGSDAGEAPAQAWYPNPDGQVLIVKAPLSQSLGPLATDRFVVDIRFPEAFVFRGPMKKAKLTLIWNGAQTLELTVALDS